MVDPNTVKWVLSAGYAALSALSLTFPEWTYVLTLAGLCLTELWIWQA